MKERGNLLTRLGQAVLGVVIAALLAPGVLARETGRIDFLVDVKAHAVVETADEPLKLSLAQPRETQGGREAPLAEASRRVTISANSDVRIEVTATPLRDDDGRLFSKAASYGVEFDGQALAWDEARDVYAAVFSQPGGAKGRHTIRVWADWFKRDSSGADAEWWLLKAGEYRGTITITVSSAERP